MRLALCGAMLLLIPLSTIAQAASSSDDEYNFDWLDKDKKIYVLQNRKFTKAGHAIISSMGAMGLSGAYRTSYSFDNRLAYYFSEAFGVEGFYSAVFNHENGTFKALSESSPNALPNVRQINSQFGLLLHYVPWYAKINVFNTILHFDWYFTGGAGQLDTDVDVRRNASDAPSYQNEKKTAFYLGTGHMYHITRSLNVRLDLTGAFYQAPLKQTDGASTWFTNFTFGVGLGLRI